MIQALPLLTVLLRTHEKQHRRLPTQTAVNKLVKETGGRRMHLHCSVTCVSVTPPALKDLLVFNLLLLPLTVSIHLLSLCSAALLSED